MKSGLACVENTGNKNLRGIGFSFLVAGATPPPSPPAAARGKNELVSDTVFVFAPGQRQAGVWVGLGAGVGKGKTN